MTITRVPPPARNTRTGGVALSSRRHRLTSSRDRRPQVSGKTNGYQQGPPLDSQRRRRTPTGRRPLRAPIDTWLAAGGWAAGRPGAFSVPVHIPDGTSEDKAREQVGNWWQQEKRTRRWLTPPRAPNLVRGEFAYDGPALRFYWWTTAAGASGPMPDPTLRQAAPAPGNQ